MKEIEKFLITILILTVISIAGTLLSNVVLARLFGATEYGQMLLFNKCVASIFLGFKFLVNVCIGVWLYITARETKWAWLVLGIFFGLLAAIFFYLFRIYELLQSKAEVRDRSI